VRRGALAAEIMKRFAFFLLAFLTAHSGSGAGRHSAEWFLSRTFIVCRESLGLSCSYFAEPVKFLRDGTIKTKSEEVHGSWQLMDSGILRVGSRDFTFIADPGIFISRDDEGLPFGIALVEDSRSGRERLEKREEQLGAPEMRRAVAHYYLRRGGLVHDVCITLIDVGDPSSVELLVAALPNRAELSGNGVECTWSHCAEALKRITGKQCGFSREDWEECLANASPPDGP
jgi:hypothetical protein